MSIRQQVPNFLIFQLGQVVAASFPRGLFLIFNSLSSRVPFELLKVDYFLQDYQHVFIHWEQWPEASPCRPSQNSVNRTQTLPCLSGTYGQSPLGAEWRQSFHRPVFLPRGLAALLIILWTPWSHWGLPRGNLSQRQSQRGRGFSPTCQSLVLCLFPDCPGLFILLSKLESGFLVTWGVTTHFLESWGYSSRRTGKDHLFVRDSCSKRIKWWRPLFSHESHLTGSQGQRGVEITARCWCNSCFFLFRSLRSLFFFQLITPGQNCYLLWLTNEIGKMTSINPAFFAWERSFSKLMLASCPTLLGLGRLRMGCFIGFFLGGS